MSREHWEQQAGNWAAWARRPDFDAYWKYAPAFFELVPPPGTRTLEIGCGEGRVSRDLEARGHRVTAVDITAQLLSLAHQASPELNHVRCDAASLPFRDASFDIAVLYNSLMDVDDMKGTVKETARVLTPGGHMCVCVTHPLADAGRFTSREADSPFVIEETYLGPRRWLEGSVERDGLRMNFAGWAYPMEAYSHALEAAGLAIEAMREPRVEEAETLRNPSEHRWRRIPNFLMWRAVKR